MVFSWSDITGMCVSADCRIFKAAIWSYSKLYTKNLCGLIRNIFTEYNTRQQSYFFRCRYQQPECPGCRSTWIARVSNGIWSSCLFLFYIRVLLFRAFILYQITTEGFLLCNPGLVPVAVNLSYPQLARSKNQQKNLEILDNIMNLSIYDILYWQNNTYWCNMGTSYIAKRWTYRLWISLHFLSSFSCKRRS